MTPYLRLTVLGSGSGGNCTYVETPHTRFLIDAGLSGRQISQRLQAIGRHLEEVQAVFLTHEHSDHITGLSVLARKLRIPVFANRQTADFVQPKLGDFDQWRYFKSGEAFELGEVQVDTFPIPHDAYDPVGYTFTYKKETIGFFTDLGYATRLVEQRAKNCSTLILESNHDPQLLHDDLKRPWAVKQRILARHGHLSNEASAELAGKVASKHLRHVCLAHLSEDCNRPELARETMAAKLDSVGCSHVQVWDTFQKKHAETLEL